MAEKDIILEEKTTEEKTTAETKEEIKEETPIEDVVLETEDGTKSLLGATMGTGDIAATSLDTKTTPAGTDNLILFNQNTNVGYQIDYDDLADAILNKLTSKTFTNQVGGSSAATLLAQLATLNSQIPKLPHTYYGSGNANTPVIIPATSSYFAGYIIFALQGVGAGLCAIARAPSGGAFGVTDIAGNSGNSAFTATFSSSDGGIKVSSNNTFTITCIYDYLP